MNERSTEGPGRRVGRDRVLGAALELLGDADLADLLSFLGTRAVATAAGVQPGTVHHHFHNRDGNPKPNARIAAAVLDAAVAMSELPERTADRVAEARDTGPLDADEVRALRAVATAALRELLGHRVGNAAIFVGAAAAPNDPGARSVLHDRYERVTRDYGAVFAQLAERFDRDFDADGGCTAESLAVLFTGLADGLALRHRFDPDSVSPELFGEVVVRLFEAATVPRHAGIPAADAVAERLLGAVRSLEVPPESGLDQAKRTKIVDAARRLHHAGGTDALTITAVAWPPA